MTTLEWDEVFDCAVAAWCRSSTSHDILRMCFQSRHQQSHIAIGWTANDLMDFAKGIARIYTHPSPPEGMVGGWQDIATAPKDGTYLLLWEQYSTNPFVGCWAFDSWRVSHEHVDAEGGWDGAIVVDSISQDRITHWMKLPESPYGKN